LGDSHRRRAERESESETLGAENSLHNVFSVEISFLLPELAEPRQSPIQLTRVHLDPARLHTKNAFKATRIPPHPSYGHLLFQRGSNGI
jgi:hypothetical protein